jgi:hypothetical protein
MGAGGYQAIEDTCREFTSRQLRALGCQRDRAGDYVPPSDSTLFRVLSKVATHQFDRIVGDWLLEQELSVIARLAVDGKTLRGSSRTDGKPLQLLSAVPVRTQRQPERRAGSRRTPAATAGFSPDRADANGLKSWCRRMTVANALKLLRS